MLNAGTYYMYVFIDNEGKYILRQRKIITSDNLIKQHYTEPDNLQPQGLRVELVNNSLYLAWDSNATLTNLTIYQQTNTTPIKK